MAHLQSHARLFSILTVGVLAFAVATNARAQRTRTGGASGTGSELKMYIQISDETVSIECPTPSDPHAACPSTAAFFNARASTAANQTVYCQWRASSNDEWTDAHCTYTDLECKNFARGDCSAKGKRPGTRISTMECPTLDAFGDNVAGCTGTIHVRDITDTYLIEDIVIPDETALNTKQLCGSEFPTTVVCDSQGHCTQLKKFVMGQVTQACVAGDPWSPDDPIVDQTVRAELTGDGTMASYTSKTSWLDETMATCNPDSGYPPNACNNDSGAWVTVPATTLPATSDTDCATAAAYLSCGQLPDGSPGPAPTQSKFNGLECQFRCDRCTPEGTLVNIGENGLGRFVLSDLTATPPIAAVCDITVTGN